MKSQPFSICQNKGQIQTCCKSSIYYSGLMIRVHSQNIISDICSMHVTKSAGLCWGSKELALVRQRQTYGRDMETLLGGILCLLSDTLLRFTVHWSSPNSSKKTSSICWANQMKGELGTLLPPEPAELTLMCRDRRRTIQPEERTKRNRTSVTQFYHPRLNSSTPLTSDESVQELNGTQVMCD